MGYFSQRKKHERQNIILKVILVTFGVLTLFGFFLPLDSEILNYINSYRFQIYVFSLLAFVYSLVLHRYGNSFLFFILLVVNYTIITSSSNILTNSLVDSKHHITLKYERNTPLKIEANGMLVLRNGRININNLHQAQFLTFEKNMHVFTVISVDFSHYDYQETKNSFNNLKKFIAQQDDPVLVIGNFDEPAWSPTFAKFLTDTGLEVKNKLNFGDKHRAFNPFAIPQFYILGFANLGINNLDFTYRPNANPIVQTQLGFY